jgi:hypothetical protein
MKRLLLLLLFTVLSCGSSDWEKISSIYLLNGSWTSESGSDTLKFSITNPYKNSLQINSGAELILKTEDDGSFFYINAYLGNSEVFAGTVEKHKTLNQIRIDRFDGGVDAIYVKH